MLYKLQLELLDQQECEVGVDIEVRQAGKKGLGVFALRTLEAGDQSFVLRGERSRACALASVPAAIVVRVHANVNPKVGRARRLQHEGGEERPGARPVPGDARCRGDGAARGKRVCGLVLTPAASGSSSRPARALRARERITPARALGGC